MIWGGGVTLAPMSIRAAIVGPTGYTGLHLIELLSRHPLAEPTYLASHRDELPDIRDEFPKLSGVVDPAIAPCRAIDPEAVADAADVAFLCLPHRASFDYVPALLDAGLRVIDLSADYRLRDPALYQATYGHPHGDTQNLPDAVYGLPELFRTQLPGAILVANPGCYPTAAALAIAPLLAARLIDPTDIIINAASGVTGAGRKATQHLHFPEHSNAFMAYGQIGGHRHAPEIGQTLSRIDAAASPIHPLFIPHLLPVERGILETIYMTPIDADLSLDELWESYEDMYAHEPMIRLRKQPPNIKHVVGTNFCDLSIYLVPDQGTGHPKVVAFAAIDNTLKGASGQAVQCMNAVFEIDETTGLI